MAFPIIIINHRKRYHMIVEQLPAKNDLPFEFFKVYALNNPNKYVVFQSNRPVLIRHRLKHKAIDWKIIKGQAFNRSALESTLEAIEAHLKREGL